MRLTICLLRGKRFDIEIDATSGVDNLKQIIHEKEGVRGIPPDQQRLLCAGRELYDDESLSSYNIYDGSEVYVVLRLGGRPNPRMVTWEHKIGYEDVSGPDVPIANARFNITMSSSVDFLTSSSRSEGQNIWRNYWTGPEYRFTDVVVPDWVVVLKLSPEFTSIATKDELKARLDAVRYNYQGINGSYYGGQSDSWQRYTTSLPVPSTIVIDEEPNTFNIHVTEQLEPSTWYAVVFLNNFSHYGGLSFYEDYLLPFKTVAPEPATLPESAPHIPLQGTVHDAFICPIGLGVMVDPVVCLDGHSYERVNIEHWFETSDRSPKTGLPLSSKLLVANHSLRAAIQQYGQP